MPGEINAHPTKEFFIGMLTDDIQLERAILDLVDNSVDAARVQRGDGSLDGLSIRLRLSDDEFVIEDNCGGFTPKTARGHAFRFGRPRDVTPEQYATGQYGIGMKRALFKLGNQFEIRSETTNTLLVVEEDVIAWSEREDDWSFAFSTEEVNHTPDDPDEVGTTIKVRELHPEVLESFSSPRFVDGLRRAISEGHSLRLEKGLVITVGGIPVDFEPATLSQSSTIRPAHRSVLFEQVGPIDATETPVGVEIYVGPSDAHPVGSGWNVYCNGRQVLNADKTIVTGWGEREGIRFPLWHNQYTGFRGYVFFECSRTELLPWNTTKTGVNRDSVVYRAARVEMLTLARPVIDFYNQLKQESDDKDEAERAGETRDTPLADAMVTLTSTPLDTVADNETFNSPEPNSDPLPIQPPEEDSVKQRRILYHKPDDEVQVVIRALGARTLQQVGELTFEYFMDAEGLD